jgi:hypothetical protein
MPTRLSKTVITGVGGREKSTSLQRTEYLSIQQAKDKKWQKWQKKNGKRNNRQ